MYELLKMHDMEAVIDHLVGGFIVILICWTFVLLANILDFWSGRNTARALGDKGSRLLPRAVVRLVV